MAKRPSRGRISKGVGKGLGSNSSCISGRVSWHRAVRRKYFYRLGNAFCSSERNVHSVASVVIDSAANVPDVNAVRCPCATVGTVFVYEELGARWYQRSSIKIKSSIELRFFRKAQIDAQHT